MASIGQIVAALHTTGLPVAEGVWEPDSLETGPHIVVRHAGAPRRFADSRAYVIWDAWSVTLYSERWEGELEDVIEQALDAAGIIAGEPSTGYDAEHSVHWTEWDFESLR